MVHAFNTRTAFNAMLASAALLGLAACGQEPAQDYETDVIDESGGDLIVEDANQEGVDVTLPETPMTNEPADAAAQDAPAGD